MINASFDINRRYGEKLILDSVKSRTWAFASPWTASHIFFGSNMLRLLENISDKHPAIDPRVFIQAGVAAMTRHGSLPRERYSILLKNVPLGERTDVISLDCQSNDVLSRHDAFCRTLQDPVITEFAAIALALLYVTDYTDLQCVEVTQRGERADYWLGRSPGRKEKLLEVSGIDNGSKQELAEREREKITQVRKNDFCRKEFFVAVCEFCNGHSIFSRNERGRA